jgi:CubicO group peptidase (beta-lactamase class C family)
VFAPVGDVYSYSSPGYWLAGHVLEQAGKRSYADLVRERLLVPLGMATSTFRPTVAMTYPLALDHRVTGDSARVLRPFQDDVTTWPSGSLFTSASELARMAIALINEGRVDGRQALPSGVVERVLARAAPLPGNDCSYAFGLSNCSRGAKHTVGHYGFRVGSGAVFTMIPELRIAVVILSNRNGGIMGRTEQAVLDMLAPAPPPQPPAVAPAPVTRARLLGSYVAGMDTLQLALRGDSLVFQYKGETSRAELANSVTLRVFDSGGAVSQEFAFVRGARSGSWYLHDGLSAYRKRE